MLEIRLFGAGQAAYGGSILTGFPRQQAHHLLCYLLLNCHQLQPREHLAAQFWGDESTPVSLKRLRNVLWQLRNLLEETGIQPAEYLVSEGGGLAFAPSSSYYLDVEVFETVVACYQYLGGQDLSPEQAARLGSVLDLYTGDLLSGLYLDWCLIERERLGLLYLTNLCKLISFHEMNGTYEHGLDLGRRALAVDDTRESVHRQMMRLFWLMGDRSAALMQYKRCAQILREALDVAPSEATTSLYRQLMKDQLPLAAVHPATGSQLPGQRVDEGTQLEVEQALRSLQRLRVMLREANAELRRIAQLLSAISADSTDAPSPPHRRSKDAA